MAACSQIVLTAILAAAACACGSSGSSSGDQGTDSGAGSGASSGSGGGQASSSGSGSSGASSSGASSGSASGTSSSSGGSGFTSGGSGSSGGSGASSSSGSASGGKAEGGTVVCPSPALAAGDTNETVMIGSTSRTYILHVPTAYTGLAAAPLVVDFHPLTASGASEEASSPYKAQTDPEGVVTAYPNGLSGPSGAAWNVGPCCVANVDDVAFAKALVAQVETKACVDAKRVYAVGFSMGGGLSHYVACHAADVFAAVAPAAFDLLQENVGACTPPRPIAEISFRDTGDPIVPYAGGASSLVPGMPVTFLGAVGTFQKWAQIDGCTGSASPADGNGCQFYGSCQGGVEVGLCTKQGGTHEAGNATVGWPFLKKYTLP